MKYAWKQPISKLRHAIDANNMKLWCICVQITGGSLGDLLNGNVGGSIRPGRQIEITFSLRNSKFWWGKNVRDLNPIVMSLPVPVLGGLKFWDPGFVHSFLQPFTYPVIYSLTHSLTELLGRSFWSIFEPAVKLCPVLIRVKNEWFNIEEITSRG
jgi:hypothetical protein